MNYHIKNVIDDTYVPKWGNEKRYIVIHYPGIVGQNNKVDSGGYGAHFYIYWDGTIYQAASLEAILWQVGTDGYYTQQYPVARNGNTIGIELCCKCDGNSQSGEDLKWYFTEETQLACVWLVKKLMREWKVPIDHVLRHSDIKNKTCPSPYVHNNSYKTSWTWEEFKSKLSAETDGGKKWYWIRRSWADESSQIGAYLELEKAKAACPAEYAVYDDEGVAVYSKTTYPWVGSCTGDNVNIRIGPGTEYGLMNDWPRLNKGNLFDVLGMSGTWYEIKIAGKYLGYIYSLYVGRP